MKSKEIQLAPLKHSQFLKVSEVAKLLKVKLRTIYDMFAQGRIPYRKPAGSNILRFDLDEIITWTRGEHSGSTGVPNEPT